MGKSPAAQSRTSEVEATSLWPAGIDSPYGSASWAWLLGLLVAATLLRIVALNQQLWFDEIITLLYSARDPIWRIMTHYGGQNQHSCIRFWRIARSASSASSLGRYACLP